jgi:hypothetical protein
LKIKKNKVCEAPTKQMQCQYKIHSLLVAFVTCKFQGEWGHMPYAIVICPALNDFAIMCGTIDFSFPSALHHVTCWGEIAPTYFWHFLPEHNFNAWESMNYLWPKLAVVTNMCLINVWISNSCIRKKLGM